MPRSPRSARPSPAVQPFALDTFSTDSPAAAAAVLAAAPFGKDIPARLLGFVARRWNGSAAAKAAAARRPRPIRMGLAVCRAVVAAHLVFILSTSFALVVFKTVNPAATTLMLYRKFDLGWKIARPRYVPLAKIPKATRNMAVRVEDGNFWEHHGIMPAAIKNAYQLNKRFGEPIYGGSTITMQTARTIFLVPEKSYLRKYLEVIIALEMEAILGKERILELYFNYAEWGKGVFGIEAASRHHYKASVASLSRDQAIRLVTLLSSPIRYTPYSFGKNGILKSRYAYLDKRFGSGAASDMPPPPTVLPTIDGDAAAVPAMSEGESAPAPSAETGSENAEGSPDAESAAPVPGAATENTPPLTEGAAIPAS